MSFKTAAKRNNLLKDALAVAPYTYKKTRRKLWILPLVVESYVIYYFNDPIHTVRVSESEAKAIVELMNCAYRVGRVDQLAVDEEMFNDTRN